MAFDRERIHHSPITAEVYDPQHLPFARIAPQVYSLDKECFPESYNSRLGNLSRWFENARNTAILLLSGAQIIGLNLARPSLDVWRSRRAAEDTCTVSLLAISPPHQRRGLARMLMEPMEQELRAKGYRFMNMQAKVTNEWAVKVGHLYGDRIIEVNRPEITKHGLFQYFKIRL